MAEVSTGEFPPMQEGRASSAKPAQNTARVEGVFPNYSALFPVVRVREVKIKGCTYVGLFNPFLVRYCKVSRMSRVKLCRRNLYIYY